MPLTKHTNRDMLVLGFARTILAFTFFPNGASQPVVASFRGALGVVSFTRTAAGTFALVFDDFVVDTDIISMIGCVQSNAALGSFVEFGAYTAATKTLVVKTMTIAGGATPADLAANANTRVSLQITFAVRGLNR